VNKKILFLINGLGLGNSTRCFAIIERLKLLNAEISIITSGNGKWFFSDKKEIENLLEIESFKYGEKDGKINTLNTFLSISKIFRTFSDNSKLINNFIEKYKPDIIITDSVYFNYNKKKLSIPLISLNNADQVKYFFNKYKVKPKNIYPQYYGIEYLDYLYNLRFSDLILSPVITDYENLSDSKNLKIKRIGPIVRLNLINKEKGNSLRGAIMLSGSKFGMNLKINDNNSDLILDVIGREKPLHYQTNKNLFFQGKMLNNHKILNQVDFAVVNGGYSAVTELFFTEKPMVVVPVPNHAEQWINAKQISDAGVGIIANETNYFEQLTKLSKNYSYYKENYKKFTTKIDGATQAADIIYNYK
jgi:uncharacterized protein (TIGR00661 family)